MFRWVVWILFFLSGACGLVYEVLWSKQLGLIFGNTVHSLAAVLAAFMAGLALGSYLAGRFLARRSRLLRMYGALELFIGLYCLALPRLFALAEPVYGHLYGETGSVLLPVVRFLIASLLLLIPTTCMGATLPVLAQFLVRSAAGFSRTAGALYAVNTFGAVLGAAAAGFFLLPTLGMSAANTVAVCGNVALGILALCLGWARPAGGTDRGDRQTVTATAGAGAEPAPTAAESATPPAGLVRAAALTFAVTGFAGMTTQIGWTRALSLSLGSSTYAFSLIVAVFILGLGLGGAAAARLASALRDPVRTLAGVLLGIGCLSLVVAALLGVAPLFFFWIIAWGSQWRYGTLLGLEALGVALLLLPPTILMGATLPLTLEVARARATAAGGAGRTIGTLYALNTFGAILGSLVGGLLLLPLLQIRHTLTVSALLYTAPGAVLLFLEARTGGRPARATRFAAAVGVLTLGMLLFAPAWNPAWISSGAYLLRGHDAVAAARRGDFSAAMPINTRREVLYHQEGVSGTVTVFRQGDALTLSVGGKPDASSGDMSTQAGLALVPGLLHARNAHDVLVIGMGSGVTVGAALADPGIARVDVVEISPEVVAASAFFAEYNQLRYAATGPGQPPRLDDPRVQLLINDGRNHLTCTTRRYDVIISEPSNPWIAGIGNLFTRQAFQAARNRLNPGGVFCQWIHRYGTGKAQFLSVMKTFADVFPQVQLWDVLPGSDYLLIGSDQPLTIGMRDLLARMEQPGLHDWLRRGGFGTPAELLASLVTADRAFREVCAEAEIHTDDNLLLEFAAPRTLYRPTSDFKPDAWRVPPASGLDWTGVPDARRLELTRELDLSLAARWCLERQREQISMGIERDLLRAALRLVPAQHWATVDARQLGDLTGPKPAPAWFFRPSGQDRFQGLSTAALEHAAPPGGSPRAAVAEFHEARAAELLERGMPVPARAALELAAQAGPGRWQVLLLEARERALAEAYPESRAFLARAAKAGVPELTRVAEALYDTLAANEYDDNVDRDLASLLGPPAARESGELAEFWGWSALIASVNRGGPDKDVLAPAEICLRLGGRIPTLRLAALPRFRALAGSMDSLTYAARHATRYRMIAPANPAVYADLVAIELARAAREPEPPQKVLALHRAREMAHVWSALQPANSAPHRQLADIWRALGEPEFAAMARQRAEALERQAEAGRD